MYCICTYMYQSTQPYIHIYVLYIKCVNFVLPQQELCHSATLPITFAICPISARRSLWSQIFLGSSWELCSNFEDQFSWVEGLAIQCPVGLSMVLSLVGVLLYQPDTSAYSLNNAMLTVASFSFSCNLIWVQTHWRMSLMNLCNLYFGTRSTADDRAKD